jgi:hypothetical protein
MLKYKTQHTNGSLKLSFIFAELIFPTSVLRTVLFNSIELLVSSFWTEENVNQFF